MDTLGKISPQEGGRRSLGPVGTIILVVVSLLVVWTIIGAFALPIQMQGISGKVGDVWNEVDRADQLLPRLEAQLKYTVANQQKLVAEIAAARSDYANAQQSGSDQAKLKASTSMGIFLKAFVENYPTVGLDQVQQELLTTTEGSFNRIAYARHKLIDAQVSYNQARIIFFTAALFNPSVQVLGSDFNTSTPVSPSTLPTTAP